MAKQRVLELKSAEKQKEKNELIELQNEEVRSLKHCSAYNSSRKIWETS